MEMGEEKSPAFRLLDATFLLEPCMQLQVQKYLGPETGLQMGKATNAVSRLVLKITY